MHFLAVKNFWVVYSVYIRYVYVEYFIDLIETQVTQAVKHLSSSAKTSQLHKNEC